MNEAINHPQHYGGDTTYEAVKVIEAWELGFALGNTAKYICRAGKKHGEDTIKDLKKAAWYLNRRLIQLDSSLAEPKPKTSESGMTKQHVWVDGCKDKCGSCNLCCLSVCKDCGLFEGALTTHCPKTAVDYDKSQFIYTGHLNYRGGHWVRETSEHSPAFHRHLSFEVCKCTKSPTIIIDDKLVCQICFLRLPDLAPKASGEAITDAILEGK